MAMKPKAEAEIAILPISQGEVTFAVVGTTPIICNRMTLKGKRSLLMGGTKKSAADKLANLKHDPVAEYRDSIDRNKGDQCATRIKLPAPAFKGAMGTAALRLPGAKKTEVGQCAWVVGTHVDLFGVPELFMSVVRSADMNKTPDIRTRALLPKWACVVTIQFVQPNMTATAIGNLMAGAGIVAGVGDFRQEKGKGNYGQFRLVDQDDAELKSIISSGGRVAQDEALQHYKCHDDDTEELLSWYSGEIVRLGRGPKKEAA